MLSDPRFFKEWRKNEKFVNDALKLDEDMIKLLTSYSTKKFKDWNWKKNFKSIERAMEFLLSHLENNRQLWVLTLQQNKDLLKILKNVNHKIEKEMITNVSRCNNEKPNWWINSFRWFQYRFNRRTNIFTTYISARNPETGGFGYMATTLKNSKKAFFVRLKLGSKMKILLLVAIINLKSWARF